MSFLHVGESLEALYAAKDAHVPSHELVVSYDESSLYSYNTFSGRLYSCCRAALSGASAWLAVGPRELPHREKVRRAAACLQEDAARLLDEMKRLDECLQMWRASSKDDDEATPYRRQILALGDSCRSLFNLVDPLYFETHLYDIQRVFQRISGGVLFSEDQVAALERFQNNYAGVILEGVTQSAIPFAILQHLTDRKQLISFREEESAREWIREIRGEHYKITPYLIHRALSRVAEEDPKKLGTLESRLFQRKLHFLGGEDPLYTVWLRRLAPGVKISNFTLGACLNAQFPTIEALGFEIFDLQEKPECMVLFGKGVTTVSLWEAFIQAKESVVPSVQVIERDPQGRFIVVEKIAKALDVLDWHYNQEDAPRMAQVIQLIKILLARKVTPPTFRADCLFMTVKGTIATFMPVTPGTQNDFHVLLDFVKAAARNHLFYFTYIMEKSGLREQAVPRFYYDIAKEHLSENVELSIRDRAALRRNNDGAIPAKAKIMIRELRAIQTEWMRKKMPPSATEEQKEALKKKVCEALLVMQKRTGVPFTEIRGMKGAEEELERLLRRT